jgi:hypothetical protein
MFTLIVVTTDTHFNIKIINSVYHVAGYVHETETFILKIV